MGYPGEDVIYSPEYQATWGYQNRARKAKQRRDEECARWIEENNLREMRNNSEYTNGWRNFGWFQYPIQASVTSLMTGNSMVIKVISIS